MALCCAWPNADERRGVRHGSAGRDECREDVHLSGRSSPRERAAQVPVPHALRALAGRDAPGVRLIILKRGAC